MTSKRPTPLQYNNANKLDGASKQWTRKMPAIARVVHIDCGHARFSWLISLVFSAHFHMTWNVSVFTHEIDTQPIATAKLIKPTDTNDARARISAFLFMKCQRQIVDRMHLIILNMTLFAEYIVVSDCSELPSDSESYGGRHFLVEI